MSNPYTDQTTSAPILNFYTDESQLTTQANPSVTELHMIPAGGVSLPSDRYIDFTLPANEGTYTAPADGWVVFEKIASSNGQYIRLSTLAGSAKTCANQTRSSSSSQMLSASVAVCVLRLVLQAQLLKQITLLQVKNYLLTKLTLLSALSAVLA